MAFIGKDLVGILSPNKTVDVMSSPNGSTTTMSLSRTPGSVNNVEIYIDGVFQTPGVEYTLASDVVTFTTAPVSGTSVVAISGDDTAIVTPEENTITSVKILDGTVTNSKLATGITSDKLLVGSIIPAGLNTDNVTGIPSGTEYTKSASDPAIDTNSGSLGKMWFNTTSGEMFVLIDATTDNNVWYNVGGGEGAVGKAFGGRGGGTVSGYVAGGFNGGRASNIQKWSFSSASNASTIGFLTVGRNGFTVGQSSGTHGYATGGFSGSYQDIIGKYSFFSDGNAENSGSLSSARSTVAGNSSYTHGYVSGGTSGSLSDTIEKFTFSSNSDTSDVGNLPAGERGLASSSSDTYGYLTGNDSGSNVIKAFSFVSDGDAVVKTATLSTSYEYPTGNSSNTHGYTSGGKISAVNSNNIEKYSFVSDTNSQNIADLTQERSGGGGSSSTDHGYTCGGDKAGSPSRSNVIDRFPFASESSASDHGDLVGDFTNCSGTQY
jgi:hypothetical protein